MNNDGLRYFLVITSRKVTSSKISKLGNAMVTLTVLKRIWESCYLKVGNDSCYLTFILSMFINMTLLRTLFVRRFFVWGCEDVVFSFRR